MRRFGTKLAHAIAVAGMLFGLAASPALADHGKKWHRHDRRYYSDEYRGDWRPRAYFDYSYNNGYFYYEPRARYYAPPRVYVPTPPPSFGLSLVFPIH
jgi:hypothetical protein